MNGGSYDPTGDLNGRQEREQRRYDRRTDRVPVRDARTSDLLTDLGLYNERQYMPAGYYERQSGPGRNREEIVMYPNGGDDVLRHEQQHVAQTSRLARMLGMDGRVQNRDIRQAGNSLLYSMPQEQYDNLNQAGKYFAGQPIELEATMKAVRPVLESIGVSPQSSFEEVLDSLKLAENEGQLNSNMRNLKLMMENPWSEDQKKMILSALNYDR